MSRLSEGKNREETVWWGEFTTAVDAAIDWTIGPLTFAVKRRINEWQVGSWTIEWPDDRPSDWAIGTAKDIAWENGTFERHVFSRTDEPLLVEPALADRAVVIKSAVPIQIPAGEQISFYVSTPMWVKIRNARRNHLMLDIPSIRLSDTWFGPTTMEGELCYSTLTTGRLDLGDLPVRAHRAITPVTIKNVGEQPLKLEKLSLPVPYLGLFDSRERGLWTEEVTVVNDPLREMIQVRIAEHPPAPYGRAVRVGSPRKVADKSLLHRTFGALFG